MQIWRNGSGEDNLDCGLCICQLLYLINGHKFIHFTQSFICQFCHALHQPFLHDSCCVFGCCWRCHRLRPDRQRRPSGTVRPPPATLLLLYLINGHKFIHFTQSFIKIRLLLPKLRCPQDRDRNEANDGIPPSVACLAHGSAESATCELHARKEPSLSPNPT